MRFIELILLSTIGIVATNGFYANLFTEINKV